MTSPLLLRKALSCLAVTVSSLLAACSTTGQSFDSSALDRVIPGKTTLTETVQLFGAAPQTIYRQTDGTAMAMWAHSATVLTDALYYRQDLLLLFGPDGRFIRVVDSTNVLASPGTPTPAPEYARAVRAGDPSPDRPGVASGVYPPASQRMDRVVVTYPVAPQVRTQADF